MVAIVSGLKELEELQDVWSGIARWMLSLDVLGRVLVEIKDL